MGNGQEGVIKYDAVRDMVKRYNSALAQFDAVQEASKKINEDIKTFSVCRIHFGAHGDDCRGNKFQNITRERFRKELQHAAWHNVFQLLNMQKYTTNVLQEKIARFVETSEARPFNLKNIYLVVSSVLQNIGNIMEECVVKAFDTICSLSAENSTAGEKWKTNSNYMVNQKFIVDGLSCEKRWNGHLSYSIGHSYDRSGKMEDFYKAMSFLTGQPLKEDCYRPFRSQIVESCTDTGEWFYFDWFRVKFYKKGTMHFEFTDINIWYRFNQVAAKHKGWAIGSVSQCKARKVWRDIQKP